MTYTRRDKQIIEFLEKELIERMKVGRTTVFGRRFILGYNQGTIDMLKHKMKNHKLSGGKDKKRYFKTRGKAMEERQKLMGGDTKHYWRIYYDAFRSEYYLIKRRKKSFWNL